MSGNPGHDEGMGEIAPAEVTTCSDFFPLFESYRRDDLRSLQIVYAETERAG